jgi:hypothetical protein
MTRTALIAWLLSCPIAAFAQGTPPGFRPPRGDVALTVGWLHTDVSDLLAEVPGLRDDDWTHDQATIGASLGWYWTENLKTEFGVETSSTTRIWDTQQIIVGRDAVYRSVEHSLRDTRVSLGQYFQFGHNQWVHPSIGAGVTVRWRDRVSEYAPAVIFRGTPGDPEPVRAPARDTARTTEVGGFVALAMKAYLTPRAFFRADTQLDLRGGIEQVIARAGLGIDF